VGPASAAERSYSAWAALCSWAGQRSDAWRTLDSLAARAHGDPDRYPSQDDMTSQSASDRLLLPNHGAGQHLLELLERISLRPEAPG
jgi:hypothetical protein